MSARNIAVSFAGTIAVLLLAGGSAGACCKALFEPSKPHMNVGPSVTRVIKRAGPAPARQRGPALFSNRTRPHLTSGRS